MKRYLLIILLSISCFSQRINPVLFYQYGGGGVKYFTSTWNTANTSAGSSASTQVKLPLILAGTYNMRVEWGDGNQDTITAWNAAATTHTYSSGGTYTIKITGICNGWVFANTGDRLKILSVSSWGGLKIGTTQGGYFQGCSNLNLASVSDVLNLSRVTSLNLGFSGCTALTTIAKVNEWNTSSVTNMSSVFNACNVFNDNVGNWDVSNVSTFNGMFSSAFPFNNGGNPSIGNWNTSSAIDMTNMFSNAVNFNQNIGGWNTQACTNMSGTFDSATAFNQNIGSWNVSLVTNFTNFMLNKTAANFSTTNLDAIYNGWSALVGGVKPSITITFGTAKYTAASSAGRLILTSAPNNWAITDGGI